jgi:protein AroM
MCKIGLVSMGQTPRRDQVTMELRGHFPGVQFIESGALDGFSKAEIGGLASTAPLTHVLGARLRDGSVVTVGAEALKPLVEVCVAGLFDQGADLVVVLCTGILEMDRESVILPSRLLYHFAQALVSERTRLGILVPFPQQIVQAREKWGGLCTDLTIAAASCHSDPKDWNSNIESLRDRSLILMDCILYSLEHREAVREKGRCPAIRVLDLVVVAIQSSL